MRRLVPLLLCVAIEVHGQTNDLLPMAFVRVTPEVFRQIARDWERHHREGREWVYCITRWSMAMTQDGDSAYVVSGIRKTESSRSRHEAIGFDCRDVDGTEQPVAHAHPSGDCTPSRADAFTSIASGAPFGLVVCGPRSTAGYSRRQFALMQKGVWYERQR